MTLQVVINARDGLTDAEYVTQGKAWFRTVTAIGKFDALICQSWAADAHDPNLRVTPKNLPEPDASSMTALTRYVLERFV
jgi:hypothetical protein